MGRKTDYIYIIAVIFLAMVLIIEWFYRKKTRKDTEEKKALWFQDLVTKFQDRFPDQPFHIDESEPFTIVVPPKHPAMGGLKIFDNGSSMIIELVPFTHEHVSIWGPDLAEGRNAMVRDVIVFVEDVFEDKIEFYGGPRGGGYQEKGQKTRGYLNKLYFGETTYVWSGPIEER
ncbi:MAG TPA: hypothetical protein VMV04_05730 [Thermodesulfobacteriota bacterium]|nr:hypothetical protein [Thermodesulfobacteriota bacterium]